MPTVIKAGQATEPTLRRLETLDLADHVVEASKIVNAARREAGRLLSQARTAASRIRTQAEETGYREGYAKGETEGRAAGLEQALSESTERFTREQADLCETMQAVVANLDEQKRDLLIAAEHDLLAFGVRFAEKLTRRAVQLDDDVPVNALRDVLRMVGTKSNLIVRIHPADGYTMRQFAAQLSKDVAQRTHVQFVEDETLTPGGCIVKTGQTDVDASVDNQIDQIVNLVLSRDRRADDKRV